MENDEALEGRRRSEEGERRARTISYVLEGGQKESRSQTIAEKMMSNMSLRLDHVFGAQPNTPVLAEIVKEHLIIAYATASGVVVLQTPANAPFGDFTQTENLLLRKHNEAVVAMALCPVTGSHLVTCGKDASYVWDIGAAFEGDPNTPIVPVHTLAGSIVDDAHANCASFWTDPNTDKSRWYLITGNHDGNLRIYKAHYGYSLFHSITCHQSAILSMDVHAGAGRVTTGATDGTVRVWNLCMDQPTRPEKRSEKSPADDIIVSSTADNLSDDSDDEKEDDIYDDSLISLTSSFAAHRGDVSAVAFAPDGKTRGRFIISGGRDNMLQISDAETQQIMGELGKKDEDTNPEDYRHEGSIREIKTMKIEQKTGEDVAALFQAVSCSTDGTVRTWIIQAKFSNTEGAGTGGDSVSADGSFKVGKEDLQFLQDPVGDALSETILGTLFESGSEKTETAQLVSSVEAILTSGKKLKESETVEEDAKHHDLEIVSRRVDVKSKLLYRSTVGMLNKYGVFDLDFCILPPLDSGSGKTSPRIVIACSSTRSLVRFFTGFSKYPDLSPDGSADDINQALSDGPVFQSSNHTSSVSAMKRVESEIVVPVPHGYSRARRGSAPSTFRAVASACLDGSFCISSPADTPLLDARGCGWINSAIREVCTYSPANGSAPAGTKLSDIVAFAGGRNGMVYRLGYSEDSAEDNPGQDDEESDTTAQSEKNYWKTKLSFPAHAVDITALTFEPHMKLLATAGADLSLSLWEVQQEGETSSANPIVTYPGAHDGIITALAFFASSGDPTKSAHMASGATDGRVFCWKLMRLSAKRVDLQKVWSSADYYENGGITSLEFGSGVSRGLLVSSSWGGTMRVWSCLNMEGGSSRQLGKDKGDTSHPKHSWESVQMRIGEICLSPNGAMVACACSSGLIRVYDMTNDFSMLCSQNILQGRIYSSSLEHISWPQDDVLVVGTSYGELLRLVLVFGQAAAEAEENFAAQLDVHEEEAQPLEKQNKARQSVENLLQSTGVPGVTAEDLEKAKAQETPTKTQSNASPNAEVPRQPSVDKNQPVSNPLSSVELTKTVESAYVAAEEVTNTQPPSKKQPGSSSTSTKSDRRSSRPRSEQPKDSGPVVTENPAAGAAESEAPQRRQKKRPSQTSMKVEERKGEEQTTKEAEVVERGNPIRHAKESASYREIYGTGKNKEKSPPPEEAPVHEKRELLEEQHETDDEHEEHVSPQKTADDEVQEKSEFQPLMSHQFYKNLNSSARQKSKQKKL